MLQDFVLLLHVDCRNRLVFQPEHCPTSYFHRLVGALQLTALNWAGETFMGMVQELEYEEDNQRAVL